jgi:hypothetical protein
MAENLDPEVIARLNEAYRNQYESLRDTNLIADAQLKAEKSKIDLNKAFAAGFKNSIQAVESFTKVLVSQESSFQKATTLAGVVADTAAEAAKQIGGVTGAMGVVLQAAMKVANAMAVQADAVVKTKDQVAKFGAVGALSSEALYGLAKQAGYYSLNMNKLFAAAGKAGGDLLIFGKNMSAGVETFAKMADVGEGTLQEFNKLGIGADELREYQADYVKYLAASGVQLNASQKTQEALRKGSIEYTKNVLELSALTGKDVDTVKKKQQEAQASIDFIISQNKLQAQADALRKQGGEENLAEAKALENTIERNKAIVDKTSLSYDSAITAAVRNVISFGGAIGETSAVLVAGGIDYTKILRAAKDDTLSAGQASAVAVEAVGAGLKRTAEIYSTSLVANGKTLGDTLGISVENLQMAFGKVPENAVKNQAETNAQINAALVDTLKDRQNVYLAWERMTLQKADEFLGKLNPFMQTSLEVVMKNFKKIMDDTWSFLKENVLGPANQYIKDVFGIDLKSVIETVTDVFKALAVEAAKLYEYFGGLSGLLEKIFSVTGVTTAVGAVAGGVVGSRIPGLGAKGGAALGAAAGGAVGEAYQAVRSYFSSPNEAGAQPNFGAFDFGTGSDWDGGGGGRGSLKGDTAELNPELQKRLMAAAQVYGKPLTINSGYRSYAEQKRLWDESVSAGRPGKGPTGMLVAKPGSSSHEKGMAVDIQEGRDPKAVAALKSQGLVQPYGKSDEVHFELAGLKTEPASGSSTASGASLQSSAPTATAMSSSDDTLIRVMVDLRNSINSKMQEMVDKVAESNNILEKIMRRS